MAAYGCYFIIFKTLQTILKQMKAKRLSGCNEAGAGSQGQGGKANELCF